jgi:hypothetical protein
LRDNAHLFRFRSGGKGLLQGMTGFPHVFELEEPLVTFTWSETFDQVLAKAHQGPVKIDPREGGKCVLKLATLLGLPFRVTFHFDPKGRMTRVRLERSMVEPESEIPESLEEQLQRHGAAIAWRRAALEGALGQGTGDGRQRPHPMMSARWSAGEIVVDHKVEFNVERGGDEVGYLADYIEATRTS